MLHPRSLARLLYVCCFSVFQRSFLVKILLWLSVPVFLLLTPSLPPQGRIKILYSVLSIVKIDSVPPMPFVCVSVNLMPRLISGHQRETQLNGS